MKSEDLMIGDWFRFRYEVDGKEIVKTFRISQIENELGEYYIWSNESGRVCVPERLEPIPLTPEILEKNFTRTEVRVLSGTKTHYIESDDFYCVALNEYTDSIWELEYTNCEAHFPLVRVLVAHAHELQNALRLIGIDKTIKL